jgi:hypothetical protein
LVFVPFYGIETATVPSLLCFARLGRARVIPRCPVRRLMGIRWKFTLRDNFLTQDVAYDTAFMANAQLTRHIAYAGAALLGAQALQDLAESGQPSLYPIDLTGARRRTTWWQRQVKLLNMHKLIFYSGGRWHETAAET